MSLTSYQQAYQISPIVLVGGVAGTGTVPLSFLLNSTSFANGLLYPGGESVNFGEFAVVPGHSLINQEAATYPFANLTTAANAMITNGLQISLRMVAPANENVTASQKLSVFTALKSTLDNHTSLGGYYNVATPSYIYEGCLLLTLLDATDDFEGGQPQVTWIWNFYQPQLTISSAQAAQNPNMSTISNQTVASGDPPGSQPVASGISNPASGVGASIIPSASNSSAANISPSSPALTSLQSVSPVLPTL